MLTAALSLASPLRLAATDRRAPLAARRRDRPPRIAPLQSVRLSGHGRIDVVTEREGMRALVLNGALSVHAGIFASVSTGSHNM